MKKTVFYLAIVTITAVIAACGGKKETKNTEEYVANESATQSAAPAMDAVTMGESLVKANDCKTCHTKDVKIVGPAHMDVAKKYEFTKANVEMLAQKIIKGGTGVWGQIPMTPHPTVSVGDAEKMAAYVLSLDGEKEH